MSRLLWAILLGALLCELVLLASGDPVPKKYKSSYRRYRRYRHPHCPKPKPVPCKPSPCKPVPCKPAPCIPCNKPTAPPPTGPSCSAPRPGSHKWANNYDESFTFECPRDASMSIETVYSVFSTCHHDRIWAFTCGYNKAAIPRSCHWLKGNAGYGQPVHFRCPNNGFISGVQSHHENGNQDRKFRFKCCKKEGYIHKDCHFSDEVNFTEDIDYDTHRNKKNYLAGVHSYYNYKLKDRRWKFEVCKMQWTSPADEEQKEETVKN